MHAVHGALGDAPIASGGSFTSGMAAGYEALIRKGRYPGPYPNILVMAGDGAAADIGLGAISGALYRNHDALFVCYDNESTPTPASRSRRPRRTPG